MLIALEKMQRLDCTSVSGSNPSVQHSTQRNHWIPLHVQVTIWWFFCTREWLWVAGAGFIYRVQTNKNLYTCI